MSASKGPVLRRLRLLAREGSAVSPGGEAIDALRSDTVWPRMVSLVKNYRQTGICAVVRLVWRRRRGLQPSASRLLQRRYLHGNERTQQLCTSTTCPDQREASPAVCEVPFAAAGTNHPTRDAAASRAGPRSDPCTRAGELTVHMRRNTTAGGAGSGRSAVSGNGGGPWRHARRTRCRRCRCRRVAY
jgi:hypothetical protein